jgi:hypothetical protein
MIFSGLNRQATSSVNFRMARRETIVCINAVTFTRNGPAVKTTTGAAERSRKGLRRIGPAGHVTARAGPVGVEELAARFAHALTGVRAEAVALSLEQVGGQALATQAVEARQRGVWRFQPTSLTGRTVFGRYILPHFSFPSDKTGCHKGIPMDLSESQTRPLLMNPQVAAQPRRYSRLLPRANAAGG